MKYNLTTYCALYKDGSYVEKDTLEELNTVPDYCFLLQIYNVPNPNGNVIVYQFKPITKERELTTIRIGNFEIINIGPQIHNGREFCGISLTIFNYNNESAINYMARSTNTLDIFKNEIFPLMNKLNELGSWENYMSQLKTRDLQFENQEMAKEIKLLKEKIKQLEENGENSVQAK